MKKTSLSLIALFSALQFSYAQWTTSGTNVYKTTTSGNVGIGTTTPSSQLELRDGSGLSIIASNARILFGDVTNMMNLRMDNSSNLQIANSSLSPLVSFNQNGSVGVGTVSSIAKLNVSNSYNAGMPTALKLFYQGSWGSATYASDYRFIDVSSTEGGNILQANGYGIGIGYNPPSYLSSDKVYINGNVGIGTTDPKGYKLAVNGAIRSQSVKVELANWPDFVFLKDYKLPTLAEVKTYIENNQHLPDMPSADEVHANGLDLGEINRLLLKKVEELTLYLIEKEAQVSKQDERIRTLESTVRTPKLGKE